MAISTELPALLVSKDTKRRQAKQQVKAALESIKSLGALAGISDRSLFEFLSLSKHMEKELAREKFSK